MMMWMDGNGVELSVNTPHGPLLAGSLPQLATRARLEPAGELLRFTYSLTDDEGPTEHYAARLRIERLELPGVVWTVGAEFLVCLPEGWVPACAEHLPVLVRRAFRLGSAPQVRRAGAAQCTVVSPHPHPGAGVPVDGAECPRPLIGACSDGACDHD